MDESQTVPDLKAALEATSASVTFTYDATENQLVALIMWPRGPLRVYRFSDSDSLETVLQVVSREVFPCGSAGQADFQ